MIKNICQAKLIKYELEGKSHGLIDFFLTILHSSYFVLHSIRFLLMVVLLTFFFLLPTPTHASVLIQRPLYIGLASGLVGSWTFDGADMNATQALDASGQGNHGTLTNEPKRTIGKIGQALDFDGVGDSINVGSDSSLALTEFSVSMWFTWRSEHPDDAYRVLISKDDTGTGYYDNYMLLVQDSDHTVRARVGCGTVCTENYSNGTSAVDDNQWHHAVLAYSSSAGIMALYVDGVQEDYDSGMPTAFTDVTVPTTIGYWQIPYGEWDGLIDDVRVYNRALSAQEIKRLYKIGGTFKINAPVYNGSLTDGLVGAWSFDGADMNATQALDVSEQSNHGTLTNEPKRTIGKIGQALYFDGTDDGVDMGNISILDMGTSDFSISAWVKVSTSPIYASPTIVMKGGAGGSAEGYWFHILDESDGALRLNMSNGSGEVSVIGAKDMRDNVWHHVATVLDRDGYGSMYVDGVLDGTADDISSFSSDNIVASCEFSIGARSCAGLFDLEMTGSIDDVRLYNRMLSAQEIKRLYNIGI